MLHRSRSQILPQVLAFIATPSLICSQQIIMSLNRLLPLYALLMLRLFLGAIPLGAEETRPLLRENDLRIRRVFLLDGASEKRLLALGRNQTIDLSRLGISKFKLEATVSRKVRSVVFSHTPSGFQQVTNPPRFIALYSPFKQSLPRKNSPSRSWEPENGAAFLLNLTPSRGRHGKGQQGPYRTLRITFTSESAVTIPPSDPTPPLEGSHPLLEEAIRDMTLNYDDAKPLGVPASYSWYTPPRYRRFSLPLTRYPLASSRPRRWNAFTAWGQIFEAAATRATSANGATNTRVQLKDFRSFYLSRAAQRWLPLQASTAVEGANFRADYRKNISFKPNVRLESDGSTSVRVPRRRRAYHFWPDEGRATFPHPKDVLGVFCRIKARLILDRESMPDDRSLARYVMNVSGDVWYSSTAPWDEGLTNGDVGMGRFKLLSAEWQTFSAFSLKIPDVAAAVTALRGIPPPVDEEAS